jgi:hypothetical protein
MNELTPTSQIPPDQKIGFSSAPRVMCREIHTNDADGVISLLTRGFGEARDRAFWVTAFKRMTVHPTPAGYPKYGYILESDGVPVGVILLIFTAMDEGAGEKIKCSVSSWFVDPQYRAFGTMLIACALKHKNVTYYNVTPAPHTWAILTAQGYKKFSSGRVVALPALSPHLRGARAVEFPKGLRQGDGLSKLEIDMLRSHQAYDCLSLVCYAGGDAHPFIFSVRRRLGVVRLAFLVYCRSQDSFVRFAGTLGKFLAIRGIPIVMVDADGPIPGLVGRYSDRNPKYFKGPDQPRLGDLAYSDRAMFGV